MGIFLGVLFCALGSFAKVPANQGLQVSEQTVQELEKLLTDHKIETSKLPPDDMEKIYRARTASHRTRLSQVFMSISKDPEFVKKFPEFRELFETRKKTVDALLEHDSGKRNPRTKYAIRVLSRVQGYDWRKAPEGVSDSVHKRISEIIKQAVGDINYVDDAAMDAKYRALRQSPEWVMRHKQLTETLDFYDTFKSRQDEMANKSQGGRTLSSPSEWIEKLETEGSYGSEELKNNDLKKRFARYLEVKDPLRKKSSFAQPENFIKGKSTDFVAEVDKKFNKMSRSLLMKAQVAQISSSLKKPMPRIKGGALATVMTAGAGYLISPETNRPEDVVSDLTMTFETADCATDGCAQFMNNCLKKLNLPADFSVPQLRKRPEINKCIEDFFAQPLHLQSKKREDPDLNRFLESVSPRVEGLRCEQEGQRVHLMTYGYGAHDSQIISFGPSGEPERMTRETENSKDYVLFSGNPQILQHCRGDSVKACRTYQMSLVQQTKDHILTALDFPRDTFRWAKRSYRQVEFQSDKIQNCCKSFACRDYFADAADQRVLPAAIGAK